MDIIVTLRNKENIDKLKDIGVKGVIIGSLFSLNFNYPLEELIEISEICKDTGLDCYLEINALISESEKALLNSYMKYIKELSITGIYFSDFAVRSCVKELGMNVELIYDPSTLMTNSPDTMCILNQDMGAVLSREISFEETRNILLANPKKVDVQIFGYLRLSYSRRRFLSNYEREINDELNIENNSKLRIEEETRAYSMPIVEDEYGTRIFSDFIYLLPAVMCEYKDIIKRGIVDDQFIDNFQLVIDFIKENKRYNEQNASFIEQAFYNKYPNYTFSTGYMFEKMNIKKDENEKD